MPGQQVVLTAIKTALTADAGAGGVNTLTSGRIYEGQGPQNAVLPYVWFEIIEDQSVRYFSGDDLDCIVQFDTWGDRLLGSASTRPITDRLLVLLDRQTITVTGYNRVEAWVQNRGSVVADDDGYHWTQTFRLIGS